MNTVKLIGSRLELLVDDWLIDRMDGVQLKMHSPQPREVVLDNEQFGYVTVFKDDDRYRIYFRSGQPYNVTDFKSKDEYLAAVKPAPQVTAYAESADGIVWERPELGLCDLDGSKNNHIVWDAEGTCKDTTHNLAPFKDSNPDAAPDMRYKAVGGNGSLKALASPDGIRWRKLQDEPVITEGKFDSQNLAFWDDLRGEYVAFIRDLIGRPPGGKGGVRTIKRCVSQDFIHWSRPTLVDFGDAPLEQLYTNAATPYFRAPHLYLAFPRRIVFTRKVLADSPVSGISDQIFMTSRDGGVSWDRRFMEAFLRQGPEEENWSDRNGTIAWGVVPTSKHELSIYWSEHSKHVTSRLRRGVLRTDGFVSVNAGYNGGEFTTKPLMFEGNRLRLNYATSAVGSVRVEIQDATGRPIEGYTLNDECYGDEIAGEIHWEAGADVGKLAGQPIRLRFVLQDADVYAFQFGSHDVE